MTQYSRREEMLNAGSHAIGLIVSVVAGMILIMRTALGGDWLATVSASVFSATAVALFLSSTLYHAAHDPALKARLKIVDHSAIYLLIAGTYTPFALVGLKGTWGWSLFGVIWSLALAGISFKLFFTGRFKLVSTLLYIAMGWLALVAIVPMLERLALPVLAWLLAGGIAYTGGTLFYLNRRLPFAHSIWHLFVLAGCGSHFVATYLLLLTPPLI